MKFTDMDKAIEAISATPNANVKVKTTIEASFFNRKALLDIFIDIKMDHPEVEFEYEENRGLVFSNFHIRIAGKGKDVFPVWILLNQKVKAYNG